MPHPDATHFTKLDRTHMSPFRIILRYFIDPDSQSTDDAIKELAAFCLSSKIEEVMLLLAAEELSNGHMTDEEVVKYCALGKRLKAELDRNGIGLSLNPWTTLYQVPRGRKLHTGQDYRTMVGESGQTSPLVACPLCPTWQSQLATTFAALAKEIQPLAIWIEDDWRLHNHGPEQGWGGCFCEEHLARFSQAVGTRVTREELLDKVLQPGKPHPWREVWFELSRQTLLEPLAVVRSAIKAANPATRLALMSSRPDQHSIEGRDWQAIQDGFGYEPGFLIRPHMEPYTEERAMRTTLSVTRQTIACLTGKLEVYPELENSPRCGVYSKSARHIVWQMLESAVIGSDGIAINHFDNMGNGIDLDPGIGQHLAAIKPQLNALVELQMDDRQADGVQVLFSPKVASHLELPDFGKKAQIDLEALSLQMQQNPSGGSAEGFAGSMQSLVNPSPIWAETCAILGIAHRLTANIEPERGPILVNAQTLNAFDDAQIEKLLRGFVVLDAVAAETLCRRGFGSAIGIAAHQWVALADSAYSYESIDQERLGGNYRMDPRVTAQLNASKTLKIQPEARVNTLSSLYTPDHVKLWPGAILCPTPQGGSVLTVTYPLDGGSAYFMAFFNKYRRLFFQNLFLRQPGGAKLLMGPDGTRCYRSETPQGTLLSVLNSSLDTMQGFELRHDKASTFAHEWLALSAEGQWQPVTAKAEGNKLHFDLTLEPLRGQFLLSPNA